MKFSMIRDLKAKNIHRIYHQLLERIQYKTESAGHQITWFGLVMFINFPLFYIIWWLTDDTSYENLPLRLSASVLCIPLALKSYWPKKLLGYLPLYWYSSIMYCLPFFFTFMTLKNGLSTLWLMNSVTALFLMLLVLEPLSFILLLMLGVGSGWLLFQVTSTQLTYVSGTVNLPSILAIFVTSTVIGSLFSRNKDLLKSEESLKEKIQAIKSLGASMAHELRTPLRTISASAVGIKKYFPTLLCGYNLAKGHKLPVPYLDPLYYESLLTACDDIESETELAFTIINMLLIKADQPNFSQMKLERCSIHECIDEAIRRYPFDAGELEKVHWDNGEKFEFPGNKLLIVHVFFNLFKNAIYYIHAVNRGEIFIWSKISDKYNEVHFKDTAKGIPEHILPNIFDRFFTRTPHGTGVGLAFCKMVMANIKGSISCHSIEDEYTEFVLSFPREETH